MPPLKDFPSFICELCTVRSVLNRELVPNTRDTLLLAYERMRMIDTVNSWAVGTHLAYQSKIRVIRQFETTFQVPVLTNTPVERPPSSAAISMMWVQQHYSVRPPARDTGKDAISFQTVRGLRSAASSFFRLDMQTAFPGAVIQDRSQRVIAIRQCSPTDELGYTMMSTGMASRLGEDSNPSQALLASHIRALDNSLNSLFLGPMTQVHRLEIARAGWTNTNLFIAWLRGTEHFTLRHCDVERTRPHQGPLKGLPDGIGCLEERLNPLTKASRTRTADVVIAYITVSGFGPGIWYDRILQCSGMDDETASTCVLPICRHTNGAAWTSRYFRTTYLWPSLHEQRLQGDPSLQAYDSSAPGMSNPEKFYSSNSYRRGGRTHVSKKRAGCLRKATEAEITEHARWRTPRAQLDMPGQYLGWSLDDRVDVTLQCM
jgi:hypothetical protein